ncbi:MAG: hypothetical protein IKH78_08190 [Ruminococcus sp.]|nr:hypothetical protein [Ruminococcus sp.]
MASISRTIRRGIIFRAMNKQQRQQWKIVHGGDKSIYRKRKGGKRNEEAKVYNVP